MGQKRSTTLEFGGLWMIAFLVLKFADAWTSLWSLWWVLFPPVPVLARIGHALGWW